MGGSVSPARGGPGRGRPGPVRAVGRFTRGAALAAMALLAALPVEGQRGRRGSLAQGYELERAGQYVEAAARYRGALEMEPDNLSALLGLERVLVPLNDLRSIVPHVDAALERQPTNRSIRSLALRVWSALGEADSLRAAARAWIEVMPDSPEPYAEWARAAVSMGDAGEARRVLGEGVERLDDATLAQEMAELSVQGADWVAAAIQWRDAVQANAALVSSATASLAPAPDNVRDRVVDALVADPGNPAGGRLAADLLVGWDRPLEGWVVLDGVLPSDGQQAVGLLRRFADRARLASGADAHRARGFALERMAQLSAGTAAERARVEAARAFVEAGDRQSAERMLDRISEGAEGRETAVSAAATLIEVMAESGRVEEAEARFREWEDDLVGPQGSALRERLARAWIAEGKLDRAEGMLAGDSSVSTQATRGWVALYRGDLRGATELFRAAGPRAGTRGEATERTSILALIQQIEPDTVPALGEALLRVARGDTSRAIRDMGRVAEALPRDGGRADLLGFAGRLAVEVDDPERAEEMLRAALEIDPVGIAAPAAEYQLARALHRMGRSEAAMEQLEHLILTFPESAMLPLARRLFEEVGR